MPRRAARSRQDCNWRSAVHCTNSTNSISAASVPARSLANLTSSGFRHSSGHSHHGLLNLCRSTSKQANRDSSGALGAKFLEILPACIVRIGLKSFERQAQRAPFQLSDADIVDGIARSQPGDVFTACGENAALKFREFFDVD